MSKDRLTCAITLGDPAGIGPEVVVKALGDRRIQRLANFLIIGNSFAIEKTARISKIRLKIDRIQNEEELPHKGIALLNVGAISKLVFGRGIAAYGLASLDFIKAALKLISLKKIDVLVTAPVNKHTISQAGRLFRGHTEYLAQRTKTRNFAMMLIGGPFKVVLATRHIALKKVAKALTAEKIYELLGLTVFALKKYFGIRRPRIGVCGLNPHSGEEGILGQEEIKIIRPAVVKAKKFASIEGPLPADTLFYSASQGKFDAVVAMYHDQGLIPLKTFAFHQGVNLTLGLPFVRTSPDHGTAYDIAGKNKANPGSMVEAIKLAVKIGSRIKGKK
ncbi:MAG: 4-hydroxythreonine-4-phosphate dehydrogenase PdxA [Candidatus Omnitrophica bacterium]|nr:4-hydroxythreonine-4-phosphate dehydrogenase PdxA [Candidatus Omnitrophota bacterium]